MLWICDNKVYMADIQTFVNGGGNCVSIGSSSSLRGCRFYIKGNNNNITIHENCHLRGVTFWMEDDGNKIEIGEGTTVENNVQLAACEGKSISIGRDCMFSHDIFIRTTDSHSVCDCETAKRINHAKDIVVGNHVWIGMQSLILKGSEIGNDSIVSARSLVTSSSDHSDNVILVGSPCKKIKDKICWKRERL